MNLQITSKGEDALICERKISDSFLPMQDSDRDNRNILHLNFSSIHFKVSLDCTKLYNLSLVLKNTALTSVPPTSTIISCTVYSNHTAYSNPLAICLDYIYVLLCILWNLLHLILMGKKSIRAVWSLLSKLFLWTIFVTPVLCCKYSLIVRNRLKTFSFKIAIFQGPCLLNLNQC